MRSTIKYRKKPQINQILILQSTHFSTTWPSTIIFTITSSYFIITSSSYYTTIIITYPPLICSSSSSVSSSSSKDIKNYHSISWPDYPFHNQLLQSCLTLPIAYKLFHFWLKVVFIAILFPKSYTRVNGDAKILMGRGP